jgi:hypothetical protein
MKSLKIKRKRHKKNQSMRKRRLKNKKKKKGGATITEIEEDASGIEPVVTSGRADPLPKNNSSSDWQEHQTDSMPSTVIGATEELAKTLFLLGKEGAEKFITTLANTGVDYLAPNLLQEGAPYKQTRQELTRKLEALNEIAKFLAEDEEVKQIIKETGEHFADLTKEIVKSATPAVKEVVDATLKIGEDIGKESIIKAAQIGKEGIMTLVSEVPVAGGIINLGFLLGTIFNTVTKNSAQTAKNLEKTVTMITTLTGVGLDEGINFIADMKKLYEQTNVIQQRIVKKIYNLNREIEKRAAQHKSITSD